MPLGRDAKSAQAKTRRSHAANPAQSSANGGRSIPHQPRLGTGLDVEIVAGASLQIIQQRLGVARNLRERAVNEDARRMLVIRRSLALRLRCLARRCRGLLLLVLNAFRNSSVPETQAQAGPWRPHASEAAAVSYRACRQTVRGNVPRSVNPIGQVVRMPGRGISINSVRDTRHGWSHPKEALRTVLGIEYAENCTSRTCFCIHNIVLAV